MKKAVLIAEKPSLLREIQTVFYKHKNEFDFDIDFLAQAGHLIGLKTPKEIDAEKYGKWDLNKIPMVYPYVYRINEGKTNLVSNIKKAIKSGDYDFVIHAGDPDGEGELLVSETLEYVGNTLPVKRFWSNDLTEGAILQALHNLKNDAEYRPIYDAALTRQHADYQIGMNITSAATLKMGDLCKLGRVKAPIIAIIVKRELEIENYVERKTYKPAFSYQTCEFVLPKEFEKESDALKFKPEQLRATVKDVTEKEKATKAPKLFKLSTLQTAASKAFKWSGAKTLSVLQSLYEAKSTSYPRTDCEYISTAVDIGGIAKSVIKEQIFQINVQLLQRGPDDVKSDKTYCNDKAISKEGHTAVIPTGKGLSKNASEDEQMLYELICRRFIAIFAAPKITKTTKVIAIPYHTEDLYEFSETIDINPTYEFILNAQYKIKESKGITFTKGMELNPIEFHAKECVTSPPSRYNDGSLIAALDKPESYEGENGKIKYKIGTPATRSTIIEECQKNGYFTKKGSSFYATDKAKAVVETFQEISIFNVQESGRWEELFDHIRGQKCSGMDVEQELIKEMEVAVQKMKTVASKNIGTSAGGNGAEVLGICPHCKSNIIVGKFGAYCSAKCGMTLNKAYGKELTNNQIKKLLAGKTILVKGLVSKKTGKPYDAELTPKGVSEYTYNGKTGYSFAFDMAYPKK